MDVEATVDRIVELITAYGLSVIGAILILVAGWIVAGWVRRALNRVLGAAKVDLTLRTFFSSTARYGVLAFTVIAVLSQFGVQTASLIAIFGAAGLAIGLALQGTLGNLAAGVMLLIFRPFKIGDYVQAGGEAGTVRAVNLFVTEFATPDNVQILVPNGQIWGTAIHNFSFNPNRRIDLTIGIAYEDDIEKAIRAAEAACKADSRVADDPAPMVAVAGLGASSVDLLVRVWCSAGDYWNVKFDLTRALKEKFDTEGISIPFPQRVIHMVMNPDD